MRKYAIGILCNFYPVFVVIHLIFGNWSRASQVIFNIVPIAVFGGLFTIWKETSYLRLTLIEKYFIGYLIFMLFVIYCYYILCLFSSKNWVGNHNIQFSVFVTLTAIYYIYPLYKNA